MTNDFFFWLDIGFKHIADIHAYDHIMFIVALSAGYIFKDWKKVVLLATAFTIGHSITLALSTLRIILFPTEIIEFLIPVTVFITAVSAVSRLPHHAFGTDANAEQTHSPNLFERELLWHYVAALFFGLIHGCGFSNYLYSLLGRESSIFMPLLAFNVGLELGQILILLIMLSLGALIKRFRWLTTREWGIAIAGAAGGVALTLIVETFPF